MTCVNYEMQRHSLLQSEMTMNIFTQENHSFIY